MIQLLSSSPKRTRTSNCDALSKPARDIGTTTIKVVDSTQAIAEREASTRGSRGYANRGAFLKPGRLLRHTLHHDGAEFVIFLRFAETLELR